MKKYLAQLLRKKMRRLFPMSASSAHAVQRKFYWANLNLSQLILNILTNNQKSINNISVNTSSDT